MRPLISLMLLSISVAAHADELTAGTLYGWCKDASEMSQTACKNYVLGVVQGIQLGDGTRRVKNRLVSRKKTVLCTPDNLSAAEMVQVFSRRMSRARPEDLKLPAAGLVAAAMVKAYPCSGTP